MTLYFTDLFYGTPGSRLFDVAAEGVVVLDNYDIAAQAGGKLAAVSETFSVSVLDGQLNLTFVASVRNAFVSGVAVGKLE